MSYEQVGKLIDRWVNDSNFRNELRNDPEAAVKKAGAQLSSEELAALKKINWSQSDEQLKSIASKLFV